MSLLPGEYFELNSNPNEWALADFDDVWCLTYFAGTLTADVYRRDEIDSRHYPVFHQMEGARIFPVSSAVSVIEEELSSATLGPT